MAGLAQNPRRFVKYDSRCPCCKNGGCPIFKFFSGGKCDCDKGDCDIECLRDFLNRALCEGCIFAAFLKTPRSEPVCLKNHVDGNVLIMARDKEGLLFFTTVATRGERSIVMHNQLNSFSFFEKAHTDFHNNKTCKVSFSAVESYLPRW